MFTRTSVVWADRIVAASSSKGLRWSSSHTASGYASARRRATSRARPFGVRGRIAARRRLAAMTRSSLRTRREPTRATTVEPCACVEAGAATTSRRIADDRRAVDAADGCADCSTRRAAADGRFPLSDHLRLELEHGGDRASPPSSLATARASSATPSSPRANDVRDRRARRRPGAPGRPRRSAPSSSRPPSTSSPATAAARCTGGCSTPTDADDDAGRPAGLTPAATLLPDAPAAADRPRRRRRDPPVRARATTRRPGSRSTTGPSPATPSRAAGRSTRCASASASRGSTRTGSCSTSATAGWPRSAGRSCTPTHDPRARRDLRDRRRSRLPGPRARPPADARRPRLDRRAAASTSACSTSTPPTPPPSAMYERLGFAVHRTDRAYTATSRRPRSTVGRDPLRRRPRAARRAARRRARATASTRSGTGSTSGSPTVTEMTNLPARLRERLDAELPAGARRCVTESVSDRGDTVKFLWELAGGARVETVLMLYPDRATVCVSSQAGCAMGVRLLRHRAGRLHPPPHDRRDRRAGRAGGPPGPRRRPAGQQRRVHGHGRAAGQRGRGVGRGRAAARRRSGCRPATSRSRRSASCPASAGSPSGGCR